VIGLEDIWFLFISKINHGKYTPLIQKPETCKKVQKRLRKMLGNVYYNFFVSFTILMFIDFDNMLCIESIFRILKLKPVVFEI
jgi:hypothetical protein